MARNAWGFSSEKMGRIVAFAEKAEAVIDDRVDAAFRDDYNFKINIEDRGVMTSVVWLYFEELGIQYNLGGVVSDEFCLREFRSALYHQLRLRYEPAGWIVTVSDNGEKITLTCPEACFD